MAATLRMWKEAIVIEPKGYPSKRSTGNALQGSWLRSGKAEPSSILESRARH